MKSKNGRYIPLGYSSADIATIRPMFQNYLVCGPSNETIDFFAVNIYEWVIKIIIYESFLNNFAVRRIILPNFRLRRPSRRIPKLPGTHILLRRWLYNLPSQNIHRHDRNLRSPNELCPLGDHCV